ncbi:MAG TPA: heavy metal translocating P-type ATPase [Leptospiraceae bacterium]|nr:heavy metal translocating P-type ATPase [Leptospiraceae bacterium]
MAVITEKTKCYHCGNDATDTTFVLEVDSEKRAFCCSGCLTAYRIIHEGGIESYYSHRDAYAPTVREDRDAGFYQAWEKRIPLRDGIRSGLFLIEGIHCASCVWLNERVILAVGGVISASVQLSTSRAKISWNDSDTSLQKIAEALAKIGYRLVPIEETLESASRSQARGLLRRMTVAGFFAGNVMLLSVALYAGYFGSIDRYSKNFLQLASLMMTIPVVLYSASVFFKNAYHALRNRTLSMDVLTATGISLAFSYSLYVYFSEVGEVFFDSICFVVFIILTGRFIESRLRLKGLYYVENIRKSAAKTARVDREGWRTVLVDEVKKGDLVDVAADEMVPVDGVLRSENAEVEESMLTGEARPVYKRAGDLILSGTRALTQLRMECSAVSSESALARISALAEESMDQAPRVLRFTDRASRFFIAFALFAAVFTFSYWYFFKHDVHSAILNMITLLIAACPCALSLAVPTVFTVSVQKSFDLGCLLKNGSTLELLSRAKAIAFDKTGTLTRGEPEIVQVSVVDDIFSEEYVCALASELQRRADVRHPIARAFYSLQRLTGSSANLPDLGRVEYKPGLGIVSSSPEASYALGSRRLMESVGVECQPAGAPGSISIYLARLGGRVPELVSVFVLADAIRPEASDVLRRLSRNSSLFLLTGDTVENAAQVSKQLGITEIYAEKTPEQKREIIQARQASGITIMVGDGINDSVALAQAHAGVSFANASEISLHSADVLLLRNDLRQFLSLVQLSRRARSIVLQNLGLSFLYNMFLIPMACAGWIIPLAGALFMSLSSLTVVLNSLRLLSFRKEIG